MRLSGVMCYVIEHMEVKLIVVEFVSRSKMKRGESRISRKGVVQRDKAWLRSNVGILCKCRSR